MSQYFLQVLGQEGHYDLHFGINTVGRNPTNDVRLHEASVSSFHCEIEISNERVEARDLQSTNGTRVNDQPVETGVLRAGDVLTLGQLRLQVECEAPPGRTLTPMPLGADAAGAPQPSGIVFPADGPRPPSCYRCSRCQKVWAEEHVQRLVWSGDGTELQFCPECSGRCSPLEAGSSDTVQLAEPSLLRRLSRTIQIGRRHRH
jgi:hypothetical protein